MDAQSAWWKEWLVLPGHCLRRSGSDTTLPIVKMVDYVCMIIGGAAPRLFLADYYYTPEKETGQLIANIGYAWLAGYPILFGLYSLLKIRNFKFRLVPGWKTVAKYVVVVSLYAYFYEFFREPASDRHHP